DGIRDFHVTGVQTCALPIFIYDELSAELPGLYGDVRLTSLVPIPAATLRAVVEALDDPALESCWHDDTTLGWVYQYWNDPERERSEERRVGKECRCREWREW